MCGEMGTPAVGYRNRSPIIVPRRVELHFFPVSETSIAKKTGRRKKRSRDRVKGRSAMPEAYPYVE